jgi:orotate phosphoribosyltransferase
MATSFNLLHLRPGAFWDIDLSDEVILNWFRECDAVWLHDGDSAKPHAELTSGKCSNGYFDCPRVLKYPALCEILAVQLARKLKASGIRADWVIGSAYAAITFSYEVAKAMGAIHGAVEKDPSDPDQKRMLWRRITIPAGAKVLQAEELITTIGTTREVRRAVTEGNAEQVEFLPFVGTIIHRPARLPMVYEGMEVVSLVERAVWAVDPSECPLCKAGSKRVKPKTHWAELTGKA